MHRGIRAAMSCGSDDVQRTAAQRRNRPPAGNCRSRTNCEVLLSLHPTAPMRTAAGQMLASWTELHNAQSGLASCQHKHSARSARVRLTTHRVTSAAIRGQHAWVENTRAQTLTSICSVWRHWCVRHSRAQGDALRREVRQRSRRTSQLMAAIAYSALATRRTVGLAQCANL